MRRYLTSSIATLATAAALALGLGTTASAAVITVSPTTPNGWGGFVETGSGSLDFINGPGVTPLGAGSAQFSLVDGTSGVGVGTAAFAGLRLDSISTLSYSTYNSTGNNLVAPALQFNLDYDLTDSTTSWQGRLVFEPYQTAGNVIVDNTWQSWDALAGNWWSTGTPIVGDVGVAQACPQSSPCSFSDILTLYPDAGVQTGILSGVLFKAGSGWLDGYTGSVDAFSIGQTGAEVTTFDFEAAAMPAPPALPLIAVAFGALAVLRRRAR